MKILIVCEPSQFGAWQYVKGLIEYLIPLGHSIDYIYSSKRDCPELYHIVDFVKSNGGQTLDIKTGSFPHPLDFLALIKITKLLRNNYDVIHSHCSKAGTLIRLLSFLSPQSKFFYTPHAYYGLNRKNTTIVKIFNFIEHALGKIGTTIVSSDDEVKFAKNILKIPNGKIRQITNGIDCNKFTPPDYSQKLAAREKLGIPTESFVFGTIARYCYQKDPTSLYEAVIKLLREYPDSYFLHVGDGEIWNEITSNYNHERIIRLKSLSPIIDFYHAIDVFVLNSRYEAYALAVLEAISCNLPLVLTECPGNLDYKKYNLNNIRWAKIENPMSLLCHMDYMIYDDTHPNHREIALKEFSSKRLYENIVTEYNK